MPNGSFTSSEKLKVDVNGEQKLNCLAGSSGCNDPDIFEMTVLPSRKISISSDIAKNYLQNVKKVVK